MYGILIIYKCIIAYKVRVKNTSADKKEDENGRKRFITYIFFIVPFLQDFLKKKCTQRSYLPCCSMYRNNRHRSEMFPNVFYFKIQDPKCVLQFLVVEAQINY